MGSLFVTGGNGFVGRCLLRALDPGRYDSVFNVSRHPPAPAELPVHVHAIQADLCEPDRYRSYLQGCDTVIHLAAATGKASPSAYQRSNVDGTRLLLSESEKAGVRKFLHVSSIAVNFPEKKHYPYALSKEAGEALVRSSRLPFTILRPTIIIGRGSPVLAGLARLASLPVMPVFGSGRARIQPIFVGDLARAMIAILDGGSFQGETLEMGGPQILPIRDFLKRIREFQGKKGQAAVPVPLWPLIPLLAAGEKLLPSLLPIGPGQLYSFKYDGLAESNWLTERLSGSFLDCEQMLRESYAGG